ncbi:MAG: SusC/RagA family TonB-linked outer membrane protein [Chitinophagaceae bacterium]|nr:SusC/RagA family TonB-linked outer membrane protein [Chitinophagaceae bacterium]
MRKSIQNFLKPLSVLTILLLISFGVLAQNRISGRVTDAKDGSGVAGVTVSVKGTRLGTQTDADGNFTINAPANANTLVFTSVGFSRQEVAIGSQTSMNISLQSTTSTLTDVVVIGYGTVRKKDVTGSIGQVTSKDFQKGNIVTPEQLIAGKLPGVQVTSNGGAPGSGSTIRIRGGASLNASNDPLIVIDGVPLDNSGISGSANALSLINPNDIESFSVLKDASAAAIYGSRASNGVILITTKKGRIGKPVVNFNTTLSFAKITKKVDVLSAGEFRAFIASHGTSANQKLIGNASTDWQDQIYQTAISSDNNISVSGGYKNMPYRFSLGYLNETGILKTGKLSRYSMGMNISPRFFDDHLKVDLNVKNSISENRFANEGAIGAAVSYDPTKPIYSGNKRFGGYYEYLDSTSKSGLKSLAPRNPLGLLLQRTDISEVRRSIGNAQFDYKFHFLPDLHANLNLGYDVSTGLGTINVPDSAASDYHRSSDGKHGGRIGKYRQKNANTLMEAYLNYGRDLKSINSRIDVVAGYAFQNFLTTNFNFPDYTADHYNISNSQDNSNSAEHTLISYYGRLNYSIAGKYFLSGTIRTDGSSKFNPNNRWSVFPSGSFAWKIKDEGFLKNSHAISDLKLRFGYGITGQQEGINYYDYISYYSYSNNQARYQLGDTFYNSLRPDGYYYNRKWEQTATYNAGLDFGFANNRITGAVDYYYKTTTDLLNEITQPAGSNFSNKIVANVGNMTNSGVEVSLNIIPIKSRDVNWDINLNGTYNENKITRLTISPDPNYAGNQYEGISGGVGTTILINSVNHPRGAFYVYQQVYDASGKPIEGVFADRNRDGIINEKDLYVFKNADPKFLFGASSNLYYKNWSAGFVLRANVGNYIYNNVFSNTGVIRNIINPLNYLQNGSRNVLETNFTGNGDKTILSDYYVQNASFLKLDNINVGYNFGKVLHNLASLSITGNVQNVFVVTKYKGLDPEIGFGVDNNFYPRPRTYSIGLNLAFR